MFVQFGADSGSVELNLWLSSCGWYLDWIRLG